MYYDCWKETSFIKVKSGVKAQSEDFEITMLL